MSDFSVYVLKSTSGRDKLLGIAEYVALAWSTFLVPNGESWVRMKLVESECSQCRKGFRLLRSIPDFSRCREALQQFAADPHIDAAKRLQLLLEAAGNFSSGVYFIYDNVGWGINVGLLHGATIPRDLMTFAVAKRGGQVRCGFSQVGAKATVCCDSVIVIELNEQILPATWDGWASG